MIAKLLLGLFLLIPINNHSVSGQPVSQEPTFLLSYNEVQLIREINQWRGQYHKPPLVVDPILMKVARYRVPHFTHNYQGRWVWDEAKRFGYPGFATDDLAQGDRSPKEAVEGWMKSPVGHGWQILGYRKLNGRWIDFHATKIGVAHYQQNWIAVFGN